MQDRIRILEPYTDTELPAEDLRASTRAKCEPLGFAMHREPFAVHRRITDRPNAITVRLDAYSYLTAIDAVEQYRHQIRKAIDDEYVLILTDIDDTAIAQEVEQVLQQCTSKTFEVQNLDPALPDDVVQAILSYRQKVANYFVCKPALTIQPKADTATGLDFGVFYGLPGQQPVPISFTVQA